MFNCSFCFGSAFKDQTRHVLNSMMGYISLPAILQKIMQVGRSFYLLLNFLISFDLRCDHWEIHVANYISEISVFCFIVYWQRLFHNFSIKLSSSRLYLQILICKVRSARMVNSTLCILCSCFVHHGLEPSIFLHVPWCGPCMNSSHCADWSNLWPYCLLFYEFVVF